ncbi:Respiratory supercomplex factor 2-like protein [Cladobotryum mycophilum]|uniref:Respiratory supercomplex factor 2-like protein n=1 Tax=Cladobotryum mycophilum TaxID=491253 RepID=A0ABR0SKX9_9HYPO
MKILSKEEEALHYKAVVKGGLVGGTIGLGIGIGGVLLASRRYSAFRGLTLPFRAFLITSSGTFGAIVQADRAGVTFQKSQDPMNFYQDSAQRAQQIVRENETAYERFMQYGREHRYSIVFASWLASMAVAFAVVSRAPMSTAQKVVQARVYAQGLTLAVLIVSAAFEMNDAKKGSGRWETVLVLDPNDPEHKHLIEKKIHKEEYAGQDLWMDMVEAEERRMAAKKAAGKGQQPVAN